jgi:hypothetical protein
MNDTYVELLVKKPRVKAASVLHFLMIVLGAVLFFIGIMTTFLITLCGLLCYGGAYLLTLNACIEYEYLYLDKELTVDKIKNQARRKTVASYSIETMEVMAPKGSHRLDSYQNLNVKDYSSQTQEGQAFELVVEGEKGRERIIIDTNEELIRAMRMAAPRKIFTD